MRNATLRTLPASMVACAVTKPLGVSNRIVGGRNGSRKQSLFQHDRREPDDPVPAHRAVAFIMKKQHAGIGLRVCGCDQQAPVHVVMASRFPHERRAKMIQVRPAIPAFFQDGGPGRLGKSRRHHAKRFAGNVTVKSGDNVHVVTHSLRQTSFDFTPLRSGQALTIPPSPRPSPTGRGRPGKGRKEKKE